jgi:hypothetical protein
VIDKRDCEYCWQALDIMDRLRELCPITMINVDEMTECPMDNNLVGACYK